MHDERTVPHFGTTVRCGGIGAFTLTEARYTPGLRTGWHKHDTAAFCLILDGEYTERFRGLALECHTGAVVVRPSCIEHFDHVAERGARCFLVEPSKDWPVKEPLRSGAPFLVGGTRARWLMLQAHGELCHQDSVTPLALEGVMFSLAAECIRSRRQAADGPRAPWLRRTRAMLDERFAEPLALTELAEHAGVHAAHLATSFRRAFGVPIGAYVRARRVDAARRALAGSDRPVSEIALSTGFCDQSHLTRVFRRQTGDTPAAYRRRMRACLKHVPGRQVSS